MFQLFSALLVGSALAGGSASEPPPPPPSVDLSVITGGAFAEPLGPDGTSNHARVRILTDKATVAPGESFRLGLHVEQDENWHTYWKSPGDIGLPTLISWKVPGGATTSDYQFPVPQRFELDGIISYGYDDQVLFFTEVTLPADYAGDSVDLGLAAEWLICEINCIPGAAELQVTVPVAAESTPSDHAVLFDHYAEQHPADPLSVTSLSLEPVVCADGVTPNSKFTAGILVNPTAGQTLGPDVGDGTWPHFTLIGSYDWMATGQSVRKLDNGALLIAIEGETFEPDPLPADDQLGGLVQVQVDGEWVRTEVTTRLPWVATGTETKPLQHPACALLDDGSTDAGVPPVDGPTATDVAGMAPTPQAEAASLPTMLGMAFLGGLLLNVMPCVFPVLTLKLFGLVSKADATATDQRNSGLAYTAGVLVSFWALAAGVLAIKATTGTIGWGTQFQSPYYVGGLAAVVFLFGLSLFGVFEIPAIGAQTAHEAGSKGGLTGSFFNGVFATLVATPCTAPFMGPAIGFAFSQSAAIILLFFTVIAIGLSFPFLVVAFIPALFKFLPNPGAWMETFKQLMGFTMIATTVWLLESLAVLLTPEGFNGYLAFLVIVGLGAWIFGRYGGLAESGRRQLGAFAVGAAITALGGVYFLDLSLAPDEACADDTVQASVSFEGDHIPWQPFSGNAVASLSDKTVFIDFTAEWCLTCKWNEGNVLETEAVRGTMERLGVVPLVADWTRRDDEITEWLKRFGRAGVPFYLVIPAGGGEPIALPEVITQDIVIQALEQGAGES